MPSKPAKYGIKVWTITDAENALCLNQIVYIGRQSDRPHTPSNVVLDLVAPLKLKGRVITTDNWFTSLDLLRELKKYDIGLVGTVRRNKRFIPPEFLESDRKRRPPCIAGYQEDVTLISYLEEKKKRPVLCLSSIHKKVESDEGTKPNIVSYYNRTKGGVDSLDQRVNFYTVRRRCRRWPTVLFYNSVDVSLYNGYIVYKEKFKEDITRRDYNIRLSKQLIYENKEVFEENPAIEEPNSICNCRDYCTLCKTQKKYVKSRVSCSKCNSYICKKHRTIVCNNCQ